MLRSMFKKNKFLFHQKDTFFILNNEKINFSDIDAIYSKDIEHSLNRVYEKRELIVSLQLKNLIEVELQADTKELEKYKILSELQEAIVIYRNKKLEIEFFQNGKILFHTKQDEYILLLENKKLFVQYNRTKRVNSIDFEVETMRQDGVELELKGEGEKELTNTWFISDHALFIKLASEFVAFVTPFESMQKRAILEAKLYKYFMVFFIPFGINGIGELFFQISLFRHTEPIATLSLISGMLLAIALITMPMYIVVDKLNARKKEIQNASLVGRKARVQEFDFSYLLLIVLVVGVCLLLWKKYSI